MATLTAVKFDTSDGAAQVEALLLDLQTQQVIRVEDEVIMTEGIAVLISAAAAAGVQAVAQGSQMLAVCDDISGSSADGPDGSRGPGDGACAPAHAIASMRLRHGCGAHGR